MIVLFQFLLKKNKQMEYFKNCPGIKWSYGIDVSKFSLNLEKFMIYLVSFFLNASLETNHKILLMIWIKTLWVREEQESQMHVRINIIIYKKKRQKAKQFLDWITQDMQVFHRIIQISLKISYAYKKKYKIIKRNTLNLLTKKIISLVTVGSFHKTIINL
jgi:hypothetical protein